MGVAFGFAIFLCLGMMAMWLLVFMLAFVVPYWITLGAFDMMRPKRVLDNDSDEE